MEATQDVADLAAAQEAPLEASRAGAVEGVEVQATVSEPPPLQRRSSSPSPGLAGAMGWSMFGFRLLQKAALFASKRLLCEKLTVGHVGWSMFASFRSFRLPYEKTVGHIGCSIFASFCSNTVGQGGWRMFACFC